MLAFATLPAPVTLPSAEVRLAYVLRHFWLAYPGAPAVAVGYAASQPQVEVAELGAAFFEATAPYPPAPHWREWRGQQVPFFFDNPAQQDLLRLAPGRAFIAADIIAGAFYLLSGWQEYFSAERDQHGRFPYAASVQARHGFVARPVVNYYFEVLRAAVEHVSGQVLAPRRWASQRAPFAAFISHDVDNLYSAWKAPAKAALRRGRLLRFAQLLGRHLAWPDAWNNLAAVAAAVAQYGGRSTFFILPAKGRAANGTPNADYRLTRQLRRRLRHLQAQGCELGVHGSLGTATSARKLAAEAAKIGGASAGVRFHYLSWEPRLTPGTLAEASQQAPSFGYDSTLGFAEHFGFRHGYCLPFYPFDFTTGRAASFLEIPLVVMDATLHHPRYLQLAPAEILPALAPVFVEAKRFGGVASLLWHNENFDPANEHNGPQQFHELMAHLQQQGAAFLTGYEIWQEFASGSLAPTS